ncbi:C39 family peptidase [Paraglaciecola sp. 20A4]|uniref:C39 family peptidase n=1 Tax=Paraglaciecola sp. 20A4 TaxID=2687288 RepID=UPI001409E5EF|nr:C39 family peptidase [Paraglaciecola sp. 20A4]
MRLLLCLVMLLTTSPVLGGLVDFNGQFSIKVSSITELRFKTIYKQRYDFSCGSATLASLLSFHYDDVVNELNVFKDMFEHGNKEKIKHQGFSLLDMKQYLSRRGYNANGFKITLEQLSSAQLPAITIINNNGYMHFVIIKGSNGSEVLVGDPAVGLKSIKIQAFQEMWDNRILFVIQDQKETAVNHYKNDQENDHLVRANLGLAIDHTSLGLFNVLQPSSVDF